MKSIPLPPDKKQALNELQSILQSMEDTMTVDVDRDINRAIEHLLTCNTILAMQGRVMELATAIHSHQKGLLIEELTEEDASRKAHEFRMWADGKLAYWEALYVKSERMIKSLDKYCENLRTVISAEKELTKI